MAPNTDPFDDLLTLEDTLYTTAHAQGVNDGARAGRLQGRMFGLEKGFEAYSELGELHGRGSVWGARLARTQEGSTTAQDSVKQEEQQEQDQKQKQKQNRHLPLLPTASTRTASNINLLYHLTDPPTFSTSNNEPSVADLTDRCKRAGAKVKVLERMLSETPVTAAPAAAAPSSAATAIGARSAVGGGNAKAQRKGGIRVEGEKRSGRGDDNMEDFGGGRLRT